MSFSRLFLAVTMAAACSFPADQASAGGLPWGSWLGWGWGNGYHSGHHCSHGETHGDADGQLYEVEHKARPLPAPSHNTSSEQPNVRPQWRFNSGVAAPVMPWL